MLSLYISKMVACSRLGGRKQKSGEDAKARKVPEKGGGGEGEREKIKPILSPVSSRAAFWELKGLI